MSTAAAQSAKASVRPFTLAWTIVPWFAAGVLILGAAWLGQRYVALQAEIEHLRAHNELMEIALRSAEQQLEAERIIGRWRLVDAKQPLEPGARTRADDTEPARADR